MARSVLTSLVALLFEKRDDDDGGGGGGGGNGGCDTRRWCRLRLQMLLLECFEVCLVGPASATTSAAAAAALPPDTTTEICEVFCTRLYHAQTLQVREPNWLVSSGVG